MMLGKKHYVALFGEEVNKKKKVGHQYPENYRKILYWYRVLVVAYLQTRLRAKSLQLCMTLCNPMDCSLQTPLSIGFSRQEYWSGLPFPSPRNQFKWGENIYMCVSVCVSVCVCIHCP